MGKPLHDDTPEEALIRHNTAVLLSIGMMLSKIAEGELELQEGKLTQTRLQIQR